MTMPRGSGPPKVTLLTKYADVSAVLRDHRRFRNIDYFAAPSPEGEDRSAPRALQELNPPEHTAARRLSLVAMRPSAVSETLAVIALVAREMVRRMRPSGQADLVVQYAVPLPVFAVANLFGLPPQDLDVLHDWLSTPFSDAEAGAALSSDFDEYLRQQVALRRASSPGDDAITRMLEVQAANPSTVSDEEIIVHSRTLLTSGNETTTSLISSAIFHLLAEPGLTERVRGDRGLVAPLVEESLRLDAPLPRFARLALVSTQLGDQSIGEGDLLSVSFAAANRDPAAFGPAADEFVVDRYLGKPPGHLSFGLGIHRCIGDRLARDLAKIAVHTVLAGLDDLVLARGYEHEHAWAENFRRPTRLHVTFS
jgi:cytochrome P450